MVELITLESSVLINEKNVCAVQKRVLEWGENSTFPDEYIMSILFTGSDKWTEIYFYKMQLDTAYELIKSKI